MSTPKPDTIPSLTQEQWDALVDLTDRICDTLEGEGPMTAMAALGNAVCSIWSCYGDVLPRYVMDEWLDQIRRQADAMHSDTKH